MQLSRLLSAAGVAVLARRGEAEVTAVTADSRRVGEGACFVAVRGPQADGHQYIAQAVAAGAAAVICEDAAAVPEGPAVATLASTARDIGPVAQAFFGWPARHLKLVGVTGTKGKTTFTYLVRHILAHCGIDAGLIGTIAYEFAGRKIPADNTTPGAVALAEMMGQMVDAGLKHAVMEVSSHALHQHRTAGLSFAAAAFTNLTGDHLDYHGTPEAYLDAKGLLFSTLEPTATAVINRDDPAWSKLSALTRGRVLLYAVEPAGEARADLVARGVNITSSGTKFHLCFNGSRAAVHTNLIGLHNVSNCLAAAGACAALGLELEAIAQALSLPVQVPGRCQRVGGGGDFEVIVDYAHTDDSLANTLSALRPLTAGRLIVLFGCGGDRDRTKRPRMARVAQELADRVVLTQDNPRTEKPEQIFEDILAGFDVAGRSKLTVEPDRRAAIRLAIGQARKGDVVVLAGKGHENYQIIGTQKRHFDDAEVAAECLGELASATASPAQEGCR